MRVAVMGQRLEVCIATDEWDGKAELAWRHTCTST
jgi:hypothetical protein